MKGKMAIIGSDDSVFAFKAVGVDAYSAFSVESAESLLKKIAKEYQIIFITDILAKGMDEIIKRYLNSAYPVIISVPSKNGSNGYGMDSIKATMEKALGVDILFNKDNE